MPGRQQITADADHLFFYPLSWLRYCFAVLNALHLQSLILPHAHLCLLNEARVISLLIPCRRISPNNFS